MTSFSARVIVVLALHASCGRVAFEALEEDGPPVDGAVDAVDALVLGPWGPPQEIAIPGLVSGDDPSMTADGLELYFNVDSKTMFSVRADLTAPWSAPMLAQGLPDPAYSPFIAPDGLTIWFANSGGIAVATRPDRSSSWSGTTVITEIGATGTEDGPAVTPDELAIVFDSGRDGGQKDLFISTRASKTEPWGAARSLGLINTPGRQERPHLSSDRLVLYFDAPGPVGDQDLWIATRTDPSEDFDVAQAMTDLSTAGFDEDPWESIDRRLLMWGSDTGTGLFEAHR